MQNDFSQMSDGQLRILKAVATLLEDPSSKITISQIAREVHVTDGAIYRHYRSKEEIFEALMGYMEANLLTPLNDVQKESTDTQRRLSTIFNHYMEFLEGHPGLARLLLGHGATEATQLPARIKLLNAKIRAQLAQMLKFGDAQGALRIGVTPEQAAELLYGLLMGTAMAHTHGFTQLASESKWSTFTNAVFK